MLAAETWVICLCAQWCNVCRELQPGFTNLASQHPEVRWQWIDIEERADWVDELDITTFPTLLIAGEKGILHYAPGPVNATALMRFVHPFITKDMKPRHQAPSVWNALQAIRNGCQVT